MEIELTTLSNNYILDMSKQIAFLSTFLGGFAATFFATLLGLSSSKRILSWVIGLTVVAACGFIISVVGSISIGLVLHPDAPSDMSSAPFLAAARYASTGGFLVGVFTLLASIGLGGWVRSRNVGIGASLISLTTLVLILFILAS